MNNAEPRPCYCGQSTLSTRKRSEALNAHVWRTVCQSCGTRSFAGLHERQAVDSWNQGFRVKGTVDKCQI